MAKSGSASDSGPIRRLLAEINIHAPPVLKDSRIEIKSTDFLPQLFLDPQIAKKILSNLQGQKSKNFYLFGSSYVAQKVETHKFDLKYYLNEISYDTEETFDQ